MGDGVRLAEPFGEGLAKRNMGDQLAGKRVAHFLRWRAMGIGKDRVLKPDFFQDAKDIGPKLDAGAHLAEFWRLLKDADRKASMGKGGGCDQAADAAAGNEKGGGTIRTCHRITSVDAKNKAEPADHKTCDGWRQSGLRQKRNPPAGRRRVVGVKPRFL